MIEALRSGVPSRAVGAFFSDSRPDLMRKISGRLEQVQETGLSDGMIITGRYGEGKTHLLNTVFGMASDANMIVSAISIGKETPIDKLHLLYQKIMANTYLPGAVSPGFSQKLENITAGSTLANEMLAFAAKELETDKLFYLFKAYLNTTDDEEKYAFLCDLEGDFTNNAAIKKSYRRILGQTAKFEHPFSKTKHSLDYFRFMSHLFSQMGYNGWVILFDEAELIGGMGKKARAKSYVQMQRFLNPSKDLERLFSVFALSSSFAEDVIDKRQEFQNAADVFPEDPESRAAAESTLNAMLKAPELKPLTREEITEVLRQIQTLHGKAYDWTPAVSEETLYHATEGGGYLLRTKIRAAIEFLDQLYQYGEAGETRIDEVGRECLDEDDTPALDGLEDLS